MTPAAWLNASSRGDAAAALLRCGGSARWVERMMERRPFASQGDLHAAADEAWVGLDRADYLEAFARHPRLGADPSRFASAGTSPERWSAEEQSGVTRADQATLEALRGRNAAYEARFGFVFLVCATGKSATEVLGLLERRMGNDPETELGVAAAELAKITRLRLEKLETQRT
ncbi:MAG TPA: 2-oxo-4-hydroxy-4-carboxy-5-ureidoimidazoline decarboxylase [Polyangiaceae bacterium]|nr:2-oxo-4-hydroxy-4-carboxy-5-ureidoimidazoline decarboxylase [Polyangiaceae bacterium]